MDVIILSAGESSRLGFVEKCSIEVGGKSLMNYSIERAFSIHPQVVKVVVRPDSKIPSLVQNAKLEFVVQPKPLGTMDAIEKAVGTFPFMLMLGDEILIGHRIGEMVSFHDCSGADGIIGYVSSSPTEVKKTYEVELIENSVKRLTEKPENPKSNLKGTGNCIVGEKLWNEMKKSRERNFVEAINYSLASCTVLSFEVCEEYFNINTQEDLQLAEKRLKTQPLKLEVEA
jgi:dTDP-glucose pyrophosphorylase